MPKTPQETYNQLKHLTSRAIELTRAGKLDELGPTLSRMETGYAELRREDPALETIQTAAGDFEEGPLAVRVLAYSADTNTLAGEAHLVAAEKAIKEGDLDTARKAYAPISEGQELRKYVEAQCHEQHDLKTRLGALDEKLKE